MFLPMSASDKAKNMDAADSSQCQSKTTRPEVDVTTFLQMSASDNKVRNTDVTRFLPMSASDKKVLSSVSLREQDQRHSCH